MNRCCENIMNLGCVALCDTIQLPFSLNVTGTHTFIFSFILDVGISREVEVENINNVSLEVAELDLPEIGCLRFQIIQPNGVAFSLVEDNKAYNCFEFDMQIEDCESGGCTETYVDCEYWQELYSL